MGACLCKNQSGNNSANIADDAYGVDSSEANNARSHRNGGTRGDGNEMTVAATQRLLLGVDVRDLILETLNVIRTLVNNDQEPPTSMLKLNLIADKEQGWLVIVRTMIETIPANNPLGPAVITLFLDESPLPTRETVVKLLFHLNLSSSNVSNRQHSDTWHRNTCIVLGCIAEKLAGTNSVATFRPDTLEYLVANLRLNRDPDVVLFSLIALEKYAQTSENRTTISDFLKRFDPHPLVNLERLFHSDDFVNRQVGFCAQWCLDNIFDIAGRPYSYESVDRSQLNAILNHEDVSEYLKIASNGLEARCDVSSFESVRCTFQTVQGTWFYEALIITPGVMQIGWATKDSKFFNHEGYGIGDDEYSVAYDGCRQLVWHNASSEPTGHKCWKPGDVIGCLLDLQNKYAQFYLNGDPLPSPHLKLFVNGSPSGFFAAASFMSFQQCCFNFGATPFKFPPTDVANFSSFNQSATLPDQQKVILPRRFRLEKLRQTSISEDSCHLCYNNPASVMLKPCGHKGMCMKCSLLVESCPLCRSRIEERVDVGPSPPASAQSHNTTPTSQHRIR